jgi:hypothetical protein
MRMWMWVSVGMGMRSRVLLVVSVGMEERRRKNVEFWMNVRMLASGMMVLKRADLGECQRQDEDAEQSKHPSLRLGCLFSEDPHEALTPFPFK